MKKYQNISFSISVEKSRLAVIHYRVFSKEKYHLHLKIESLYLKSLTRLSAQKTIMNILKNDLKTKIHALEISIE